MVIKIHREGFYVHNLSESSKHTWRGVKMAFSKTRNGGSRRLGPTAEKLKAIHKTISATFEVKQPGSDLQITSELSLLFPHTRTPFIFL